jgi:hypothetical protein
MISSAVLTVVFTPGLLILFYGLKKMDKGRLIDLEDFIIPLGFVLGIFFFCVIHYSYTGTFIYFRSTTDKIFGFLGMNRTPGSLSAWIFNARWLSLSAIILFYSLLKLILAKKEMIKGIFDTMKLKMRPEILFILICNVSFICLAYLQLFRNQGTISDPYYFSQGIPIITLGLMSIVYKEYQLVISKNIVAHIGIGLLCLLIGYHFQSDLFFARLFYLLCAIIFLSAIAVKVGMFVRSGLSLIFLGSIVALGLILSHVPGFGPKYTPESVAYIDSKTQKTINLSSLKREYFLRSVEWFKLVNEIDPLRKTLMWYDRQDPYGRLFIDFCATSHIWQGGLINQQFPLINVPENDWTGPTHIAPQAGMEILIVTSYKEQKLTELSGTLKEKSLKFIITQNLKFNHSFAVFDVVKIKLVGI